MNQVIRLTLFGVLLAFSTLTYAAWTEVSSRHVVIYSEEPAEQMQALAGRIERLDYALRQLHRLPDPEVSPTNRLQLFLIRGRPGGFEEYVLSRPVCIGCGEVPKRYFAKAGNSATIASPESQSDIFRLYAYHFIVNNFATLWPAWVVNGHSELYSSAVVTDDGRVQLGLPVVDRADAVLGSKGINMDTLLGNNYNVQLKRSLLLTARSWLLVHYLTLEAERKGQLARYLEAIAQEVPSLQAAAEAFGDLTTLDRELDTYLAQPSYSYLEIPAGSPPEKITSRVMSAAEQQVAPLRIQSRLFFYDTISAGILSNIRSIAERFPKDASVQAIAAELEFGANNHRRAEAAADRAIAADPQLSTGHLYKGLAQLARARSALSRNPQVYARLRESFLTANRLDPEDPRPLQAFYASFTTAGEAPTANAAAGLYRAFELAPQDPELRQVVAYQYLADGNARQARVVLRSLATAIEAPAMNSVSMRAGRVLGKLDRDGAAAAFKSFPMSGLKYR